MRITLVVPGLAAFAPEVLAKAAPLARIAALAAPVECDDLDRGLLQALGLDIAPAPLAALGAGVDVGAAWVVRADPVTLVLGRDDVRLEGRVDDLDPIEAETLFTLIASHFVTEGLAFAVPRPDTWFALSRRAYAIETTAPEAAAGCTLRPHLPRGTDAGRWLRWLTEAQMLLHDHPLASRETRPVNGLWFSAGGALPERGALPELAVGATQGREGDVARGLARLAERNAHAVVDLEAAVGASAGVEALVVALATVRSTVSLESAMRDFVAPALAYVERGTASELTLVADGAGVAARWQVTRPSWLERNWPRRAIFAVPPASALR